ncbi:MAG: hypothetical protein OXG24_03545 [Gammaproteobacteria bacterium]|nr:hypothetical protein [Gammaproteobacteria bacterium]
MLCLTGQDHEILDKYLNKVLDNYKNGTTSLLDARIDLVHTITLAAKDDNLMPYVKACLVGSTED